MNPDHLRRSRIALGVAVMCGVAFVETSAADRLDPNPASPYVWACLGAVGSLALLASLWFGAKARRDAR